VRGDEKYFRGTQTGIPFEEGVGLLSDVLNEEVEVRTSGLFVREARFVGRFNEVVDLSQYGTIGLKGAGFRLSLGSRRDEDYDPTWEIWSNLVGDSSLNLGQRQLADPGSWASIRKVVVA
jgi:hypothetical protein